MKEQILKVLIADQHPPTRTAIKNAISKLYPNAVFSESEDGASTLLLLNNNSYHLVIVDENIPILSGIEIIENTLRTKSNSAKFILLSSKHNFNNYQKATKLGIDVFIDRAHVKSEIKYGIRAIINGTRFLCGCLTEEISTINKFTSKIAKLSTNERVFLGELTEGKSISEISDKLVLSNKSINQITSNICAVIDIPLDHSKLSTWAKSHKHYFN